MNTTLIEAESAEIDAEIKKGRARLYASKEETREHRTRSLRTLLHFAKQNSPWYREQLAHLDIDQVTEGNLEQIPTLNKATLMANWDKVVTDPALTLDLVEAHTAKMRMDPEVLYFRDRYHVLSTSGSSGRRGVYIYDRPGWVMRSATNRRFPWLGEDFQPIPFPRSNISVAQVVITNPVYGMYSSAKTYRNDVVENIYVPMTLPVDELCARLNAQPIHVLTGLPSTIHKLCLEAARGKLTIDPLIVYSTAEPLYPPIRELIKETWPKAHLYNALVSSEGIYARNCHAESKEMHLNDDICIVEPVDKNDRRVASGVVPAKVYVTNLVNYTLPLIRYESPDQLVFLDKECPCGCHFQLIEEPPGRPEFDFTYPDGLFVHHLVFVTPLLHERNVQEYQVWQTPTGANIKIVAIGPVDKPGLIQAISRNLVGVGLSNPVLTIEEVPKLEYPPSGKLRRFMKLEPSA